MTPLIFEEMLTGGHPNSLGRTVEVVDCVLTDHSRLDELLSCYRSEDEVVRLRTSSALVRIEVERHAWLIPHLDHLIDEVGKLQQASTQWTLAKLFGKYTADLSASQYARTVDLLQSNLTTSQDWIVLINTMETLALWANSDAQLRVWLRPQIERLLEDPRKSVAARALKQHARLFA
jgi:hypothetical protein